MSTKKQDRQMKIQELLAAESLFSQEQLLTRLESYGIEVTQTTLSRDLSELGVMKGPEGYVIGDKTAAQPALQRFLVNNPVEILQAQNMVVLKTKPGYAPMLGLELDQAKLDSAIGTLAGDDTVFIATASNTVAKSLCERLSQWSQQG